MSGDVVRICCVQAESIPHAPDINLARAQEYAREARKQGASLVMFPEQYPTGWNPHDTGFTDDGTGVIFQGWAAVAKEAGVHVLGSYRKETATMPQNVAAVFTPEGDCIAEYAKIHLFSPGGEDLSFLPGGELATFTLGGIRFGIAICYDLRFPDLFCAYARTGCSAVIVPAAWPCARLKHWNLFLHARALENQMYVAGINPAEGRAGGEYCGGTAVINPQGEAVARVEGGGPALLLADINPAEVLAARAAFPVCADRRDDLYPSL
ncbi:nitrilase-related carbon-nitrogen hydrolase [Methanogenium organophilum]|uniref:Carbon-nitrogen hydrolase family protein n=1 Tax=Methanogenium organophilum TaxID=2199 RepID=A0A9X9T7D9_METOG|nr:nitrilase-related carbon-nitrogen hydrolase [Methanogenium organophilum]WAI00595.1 carbon-nitrogen hydrolase family protein [Methanogenium organophilum]